MDTLNRSAIVVKPKQRFLDWLHTADPTSHGITFLDVGREPTIYLIPECDTDEDLADVLRELCEVILEEQLAGWYRVLSLATRPEFRCVLPMVRVSASLHAGRSLRWTSNPRLS